MAANHHTRGRTGNSRVSFDQVAHSFAQQPRGRQKEVVGVVNTNPASLGNKKHESQFGTLDADVVTLAETWVQPKKGDNEMKGEADGPVWGGMLIEAGGNCNNQGGHKLCNPNKQAPSVVIVTRFTKISVLGTDTSLGSTSAEDLSVLHLSVRLQDSWKNLESWKV